MHLAFYSYVVILAALSLHLLVDLLGFLTSKLCAVQSYQLLVVLTDRGMCFLEQLLAKDNNNTTARL